MCGPKRTRGEEEGDEVLQVLAMDHWLAVVAQGQHIELRAEHEVPLQGAVAACKEWTRHGPHGVKRGSTMTKKEALYHPPDGSMCPTKHATT